MSRQASLTEKRGSSDLKREEINSRCRRRGSVDKKSVPFMFLFENRRQHLRGERQSSDLIEACGAVQMVCPGKEKKVFFVVENMSSDRRKKKEEWGR